MMDWDIDTPDEELGLALKQIYEKYCGKEGDRSGFNLLAWHLMRTLRPKYLVGYDIIKLLRES